jgi:signal transduction histidine kinase
MRKNRFNVNASRTRLTAIRRQVRMEERARMARELHDGLLQGLFSASLRLDVADSRLALSAPAKPLIQEVQQQLRRMIDESRSSVRGLRARPSGPKDLERAFAQLPEQLRVSERIEYRLVVAGTPRPLRPLMQEEVHRIGNEALANAFRHSQASHVDTVIEYSPHHFRLLVRDDGIGIHADVLKSGREGHWGLSGMRERASQIGATLDVQSVPGAGTEIDLCVPASTAFYRLCAGRSAALAC